MTLAADYAQQLQQKQHALQTLFADMTLPELEVFDSPAEHYRMRAEFRIWHEGCDCCYAMFAAGQKPSAQSITRLTTFDAAHENISRIMPLLLQVLRGNDLLRIRLYQVDFLTTLAGDTLISLIYHKKLDETWTQAAQQLAAALSVQIIGRSRGQKIVLERDYVVERLHVNGREWQYRQVESAFSQPNARVCEKMLTWACAVAHHLGGDLLELYCGNGNFTLPLSTHFQRVLATELSKTSVHAAEWNIQANHVDNIAIARLSAAEFTQAYQGVRPFKRLMMQHIDLREYAFSTVFVDPPRSGIDADTLALLQQFDNIIYVSCNPMTLHENLHTLLDTHDIQRMALFDQFPFTPHIETGVWLRRKS